MVPGIWDKKHFTFTQCISCVTIEVYSSVSSILQSAAAFSYCPEATTEYHSEVVNDLFVFYWFPLRLFEHTYSTICIYHWKPQCDIEMEGG